MKILFITAFPPCQKTAGQDYSRRLILDLLEKGHEVTLIYAEYPGHTVELPDSVKVLGTIHPALKNCLAKPCFHPFFTRRFEKNVLVNLQSIVSDFDMLYFDFSQVHFYSLFISHPCKVLMCHDVIAQKFSRKGRLQLPWIRRTEGRLLRTAGQIVTFSRKDGDFIQKTYGMESVNVNFYLKNGHFDYLGKAVVKNRFCFYGAWNREENTEALEWFISHVYPKLSCDAHFIVIGGGMSGALLNKISTYKNFSCLGFVDDPVEEIACCQALIAPLHKGAGVKVKVIDALSSGSAVIGTDVAFEGIEDNTAHGLFFFAESPEEFADILNNWQPLALSEKQAAADEFFARYNSNHFTDLLSGGRL